MNELLTDFNYRATRARPFDQRICALNPLIRVRLGVYVTVLATPLTETPVLEKFGLDPKTSPLKPMSVEQCVSEALDGLRKNRSKVIPGRLNRIMNALVPTSLGRKMQADMIGKGVASKAVSANARAEV